MFSIRQKFIKLTGRRELVLFILLLGVFAAYWPALSGQYIWDDSYLVGENPLFRSPLFVWEVFRHYLYLDSISTYYRPVQNLSYMLDYWIWGDSPFGYHFSNILLHGLSAYLLFSLLKQILPGLLDSEGEEQGTGKETAGVIAFCVALVWAVHPIHNAAVAYIAGRADSLISLFALSAWLLVLRSEKLPAWGCWPVRLLAVVSGLFALCSKEAGLLWMVLFVVWSSGFAKGWSLQKRIGLLLATLMIVAAYVWLHHLPGPRQAPPGPEAGPFSQRLILMFRALGDYTGLIFWPSHLHMERSLGAVGPYPDLAAWVRNIPYEYKTLLGGIALSTLLVGMLRIGPGRPLCRLGGCWFLVGFLPISNLIPLNAQAAEHWIYMPSIGFLLFLAGLVLNLRQWRVQITTLALALTVPLAIRTAYRSADWVTPETLFKQTIQEGGDTHRVQLNLSNLATRKGNFPVAEGMLREVLRQYPNSPLARINLGINLIEQKDPSKQAEAEQLLNLGRASLQQASGQIPYAWRAPLNLAGLRAAQHREAEALALLNDAIQVFPEVWELAAYKAILLQKTKGAAAAIPEVQKYVDAHWWHFAASMVLGDLRGETGETAAAMEAWRGAGQLDIHSALPFLRMAKYAMAHQDYPLALDAQSKAVSRDPDRPANYLILAAILDQLHRPQESDLALHRAQALKSQLGEN